ncbi:MAG: hypothetical protein RL220_674 [Bacteroidota bacterium]|jgi:hypothetical protein
MKYVIPLLFITLALYSCSGTKHYTKLGLKQEENGLTEEAAGSYYIALQKKRTNVDAQIGMKKTGQLVLNNKLNEFSKARNFGSKKDAVYSFHTARDYRDKIKGVGVNLDLAEFYVQDYNSVKEAYMYELYEEGTSLLEEEKFQEAEKRFNEIKMLDPNFKDAGELGDIAYLEPLYSEASKSMEAGMYRKAYEGFEKVIARKSSYKDAVKLKQECLDKGTYTIALLPFTNASGTEGMDAKISAYTLEALTKINDPFLRIVDREHMQAILTEQKLQLSGVVDEQTAVQVGQLVGAQAILTGTVLSYEASSGQLKSTSRTGYESYREKKVNAEGQEYFETKYKKVNYNEYYNQSSCQLSFQYKLISLATGELLKTEILEKQVKDEVLYATYQGDSNNLYPATQSGPNLNAGDRKALLSMIQGRQQLKSSSQLSNDVFETLSRSMSQQIDGVVLQLVK